MVRFERRLLINGEVSSFRELINKIQDRYPDEQIIGYETKGRTDKGQLRLIITFAKRSDKDA